MGTKQEQEHRVVAINYYLESMLLHESIENLLQFNSQLEVQKLEKIYVLNKSDEVQKLERAAWANESHRHCIHLALKVLHVMYFWTIVQFIACLLYILMMRDNENVSSMLMMAAFVIYAI